MLLLCLLRPVTVFHTVCLIFIEHANFYWGNLDMDGRHEGIHFPVFQMNFFMAMRVSPTTSFWKPFDMKIVALVRIETHPNRFVFCLEARVLFLLFFSLVFVFYYCSWLERVWGRSELNSHKCQCRRHCFGPVWRNNNKIIIRIRTINYKPSDRRMDPANIENEAFQSDDSVLTS